MPEIAKLVTLDLKQRKLFVDGQEFPWWIDEKGPILNNLAAPGELRSVTLTFYADDVEVIPENVQESAEKPQVARG
jgi:hypothetical protein